MCLCSSLFVLIFTPFPHEHIEFDDRKLFVTGLGIIVFLSMLIVRIVYPFLVKNPTRNEIKSTFSLYTNGFNIWLSSTAAFAIYLDYAGDIDLSFYILFQAALLCLAPSLILAFYDRMTELKQQNESLTIEKGLFQKQVNKSKEDYPNTSIDFISENNGEKMNLLISEVVLLRSADNYVEIHYQEGDQFKKKLIRNTLKNVELKLAGYSNFVRCHRVCIVNTHYIEKFSGNCNNHALIIKGHPEPIPVSRQYFFKLKETL